MKRLSLTLFALAASLSVSNASLADDSNDYGNYQLQITNKLSADSTDKVYAGFTTNCGTIDNAANLIPNGGSQYVTSPADFKGNGGWCVKIVHSDNTSQCFDYMESSLDGTTWNMGTPTSGGSCVQYNNPPLDYSIRGSNQGVMLFVNQPG